MKKKLLSVVTAIAALICTQAAWGAIQKGVDMKLETQVEKFAPVNVKVDDGLITAKDNKFVEELVAAAKVMDDIFFLQVWNGNTALKEKLLKDGKNDSAAYQYFEINYGPYDRLDHNKPFIQGVPAKPEGANFYPTDMTKEEFETWIKNHPEDKEAFESSFTVIKREGGKLVAVPYSKEYAELLTKAATHLKNAAKLTKNASLKKYLVSRADAFLSNNYYASDVDWVHLKDHDYEVVFGPYEVYEDGIFGYKAAFEAFITRVDPKESERLSKVEGYLADLEKSLPIADEYKGIGRKLDSPIIVAQEIYTAGDARRGVQTLAFNLPNDEKVRKDEGSKKVMLKNVGHAKFDKILMPIAKIIMKPEDVKDVDFESFFTHTLLHEMSHGIGPGDITKNGQKTSVNRELKNYYSTIEEAKADTLGVYNKIELINKGLYPKDDMRTLWSTYLAGLFRSMRFGIAEAHGGANAIQFNYLMDKGALTYDPVTQLFGVNKDKIQGAIKELAHDLLMIEAKGDYEGAKNFITKYKAARLELKKALAKLDSVPVDIRPMFAYK